MTTTGTTIELPAGAEATGWHRTKRGDKLRFVHPESGWNGLVIEDAFGRVAWQGFGPKGRTLRPRWVPAPSVEVACRDAVAALAEVAVQVSGGGGGNASGLRSLV